MVAPSRVVYEVANAIFVRERNLRLAEASVVELVDPSESLMLEALAIASRNNAAVYDCVFVALCLRSGLALKTRDSSQMEILEKERALQSEPSPVGGREK